MDVEVGPDVPMHGMSSIPTSDDLGQQILSELRDFRKEFNNRNQNEESVGFELPKSRPPESTHSDLNPHESESPPQLPPRQTNYMPGGFGTYTMQSREIHQQDSSLETAKIRTYYEGETKKLRDEIQVKQSLWEGTRQQNVDISKELNEQKSKVAKLQTLMVRAGRNENHPIDGDISSQFVLLKSDVLQMVKSHLSVSEKQRESGASSDLGELFLRKKVALALYETFFSPEAMPFGFDDRLFERNPLRIFEHELRRKRCDESAIKEWRVATIKTCKLLGGDLHDYAKAASDQIWNQTLQFYHRKSFSSKSDKVAAARADLLGLCKRAAELALLFRGSNIDYMWEQKASSLPSWDFVSKDHEIIGTKGPNPHEDSNFEISYIVFGGVIRGDKSTGLLENGRIRLSKTQVVITRPRT